MTWKYIIIGYIILTYISALVFCILYIKTQIKSKEKFDLEKYMLTLFLAFAPFTLSIAIVVYIYNGIVKGEW